MRKFLANNTSIKLVIGYLLVAVVSMSFPGVAQAAPGVSITANGQDSSFTLATSTDSFTIEITSTDVTACELTAPNTINVATSTSTVVPPSDPWYPAIGGSTTFTVNCTDGTVNVTDTVVVNLPGISTPPPPPPPPPPASVTADIKANGSDGPVVTITSGSSFTIGVASTGATACQITAPNTINVATSTSTVVPPSDPWYPTATSSTTFTLNCTNGTQNAADSVTVALAGTSTPASVTADIKADGSDGPTVTVTNGNSFTISISSTGATACQLTAPNTINVATSTSTVVPPSDPWYPAVGGTTTFTLNCTNGTQNATDSVSVTINQPSTPPGGGGGGGGGGGSSRPSIGDSRPGEVLGSQTVVNVCPWISSYMRMGQVNDRNEVIRLQVFLNTLQGANIPVTGVFDAATDQAVRNFQLKYSSEVLAPWGVGYSTGYVYITTLRMINKIVCGYNTPIPQLPHPTHPTEIGKESGGKEAGGIGKGTGSVYIPLVGTATTVSGTLVDNGQSGNGHMASMGKEAFWPALTTLPDTGFEAVQCIYEFLIALIVLYILWALLDNVLYKDTAENVRKKFYTKWITFAVGSLAAGITAFFLEKYCLMWPFFVVTVLSLAWMIMKNPSSPVVNRFKWTREEGIGNSDRKDLLVPNKG